jgi:Flp pilus assembly pilin Flp
MIWRLLRDVLVDDGGATLVEYAVILALLSVVGIAGLLATGTNAGTTLNNQQSGFDAVQTAP